MVVGVGFGGGGRTIRLSARFNYNFFTLRDDHIGRIQLGFNWVSHTSLLAVDGLDDSCATASSFWRRTCGEQTSGDVESLVSMATTIMSLGTNTQSHRRSDSQNSSLHDERESYRVDVRLIVWS